MYKSSFMSEKININGIFKAKGNRQSLTNSGELNNKDKTKNNTDTTLKLKTNEQRGPTKEPV